MRSLRARPIPAVCIFVLTMLTVAAAAAGPLVSRAIDQSALAQALATAPAQSTDIVLSAQFGPDQPLPEVLPEVHAVAAEPGRLELFRAPVDVVASYTVGYRRGADGHAGRLIATSDRCDQTPLIAGHCPSGPTQAALVLRSAGTPAPAIGSRITMGPTNQPIEFTVVGIVDRSRSALSVPVDPPTLTGEDVILTNDGLNRAGVSGQATAHTELDPARLRLGDLGRARDSVATARQKALGQDVTMSVITGLTDVLDQSDHDRDAAGVLLLLVTAQALAASWLGAFVVFGVLSQERQREWALGRLRGLGRRPWLRLVFAEPVALLLIGTVAGFAVALGVGQLTVSRYLRPDTPLEPFRAPVLLAALLAAFGSVAALVVASRRGMRAPLAALLREGGEPARVTRLAAISETVVLVLAVAAVVELVTTDDLIQRSAVLGLLSPALLAAAFGLLAIRGLVVFGRRWTRRPGRSLAGVLLLRRLVRTPTQLRGGVLVAIAASVLVFVTQLAALSNRNENLLAQAGTGAATVLMVKVPAGRDLVQAVRRADPSGRVAMAVQERGSQLDNGTSRIIAVDSSRLAAVAAWRPVGSGLTVATVAARLHPVEPAPVTLTGNRVSLTLTDTVLSAQGGGGRRVPVPRLILTVSDGGSWHDVDLGTLRAGASTLTGALGCPTGCRLVQVSLQNTADTAHTTYVTTFVISALATDRQRANTFTDRLRDQSSWRTSPAEEADSTTEYAKPTALDDGLHLDAADLNGQDKPSFEPTDVPDPMPAFVASGTSVLLLPGQQGALEGTGLGGDPQLLDVAGPQLILPRLLGDGVLVDLSYAQALSDPANDVALDEVWLTAGAHPDVLADLKRQGISVTGRETVAAQRHSLNLAATARAALGGNLIGMLVVVLAAAGLLAGQLLAAQRRRELWDVLRLSRISPGRRFALAVAESALLALAGLVFGLLAAVATLLLAGRRIPLFAQGVIHQPLQVAPAWTVLTVTVGLAIVLILALSALTAGVEHRQYGRVGR